MAKILVVDDSVSMRQMVAFTLKGAGHEVALCEALAEGSASWVSGKKSKDLLKDKLDDQLLKGLFK